MPLYTRTGDKGETGLGEGSRVPKDHPRIEALGAVDELMAAVALARSMSGVTWVAELLTELLPRLSTLCARLALAAGDRPDIGISEEEIRRLEAAIDRAQGVLPPLRGFHSPGKTQAEAALHLARTMARRAERVLVRLGRGEAVEPELLAYLNRLSDLLFALALVEGQEAVVREAVRRVLQRMTAGEMEAKGNLAGVFGLTLGQAQRCGEAARRRAAELGVPMVVAVVDGAGHLVLLERMEGALLVSIDLAVKKAYTAVALRLDTASLGARAGPGFPLYGIQDTDSRLVVFGGGIPLWAGGRVVGGVGVSGGSVEQDVVCAEAAVAAWGKE